jgi:hypothetical protein
MKSQKVTDEGMQATWDNVEHKEEHTFKVAHGSLSLSSTLEFEGPRSSGDDVRISESLKAFWDEHYEFLSGTNPDWDEYILQLQKLLVLYRVEYTPILEDDEEDIE